MEDLAAPIAGAAASTAVPAGTLGFVHAFVSSLSMIVVSEIGDKTFFIAAIMAMRHPRLTVFAGAMSALIFMTILSALFGFAIKIIPTWITYYISTALFAIFGFKMIYDGIKMTDDDGEYEEVQASLKRQDDLEGQPLAGEAKSGFLHRLLSSNFPKVFLQALTMTFLAEWGDRSQLATVVLAVTEDVLGVVLGGVIGHSMCTGLAVIGGRMIAQKISVKTVTIIGGIVFLLFAITSLFWNPNA